MTKKDFVMFARMIRAQRQQAIHKPHDSMINPSEHITVMAIRNEQIDSFVSELCDIFASDNSQFNKARFMDACEID